MEPCGLRAGEGLRGKACQAHGSPQPETKEGKWGAVEIDLWQGSSEPLQGGPRREGSPASPARCQGKQNHVCLIPEEVVPVLRSPRGSRLAEEGAALGVQGRV